jgi:hypothetical protein
VRSVVRARQTRRRLALEMVWSMGDSGFAGHGTIVDLSVGGARIQLKRNLPITVGSMISLSSSQLEVPVPIGRVRWVRHVGTATVCGIEFNSASPQWPAWVAAQSTSAASGADAAARDVQS